MAHEIIMKQLADCEWPARNKYNSSPQGGAHQLVTQCQMVNPEDKHANNVKYTEHVIFRNIQFR